MSDSTTQNEETQGESQNENKPSTQQDIEALVEAKAAEKLKDIKSKLDNAYGARDAALAKAAEYERKEREAEIKRLEAEGKVKEAFELQLAQEKAARDAAEKRITELTRDSEVRGALLGLNFRNDKAGEMAYQQVVSDLVKDEKGNWIHKSGVSIKEFVKAFSDNEDNSFLFKPKASSGGGSSSNSSSSSATTKNTSLFTMSQEEVLKMAREGKLPRKTR